MSRARSICFVVACTLIGQVNLAASADEQGSTNTIEEITVMATRAERNLQDVPAAVSVLTQDQIQRGRQRLGLDESLNRVPGVFSQNRYNFARDLRLAIRGFGARANFGIRGVKIYADGIPATMADGQSGVDDIDLGSIARMEVTRGPASSLYGASSGGVINLFTEDAPEQPFVETRVSLGAYDHQNYQLKAGGRADKLNYLLSATHLSYDGYRDNARAEASQLNSKFRYDFDATSDLTVVLNLVNSPTAQDPGAVTLNDLSTDRRQAQPRNLSSNSGEALDQQKVGFVYNRSIGKRHSISVRNYYLWRDFEAFLPIGSHIRFVPDDGVVEFDRFFWGGGVQYAFSDLLFGKPNALILGVDAEIQEDDRQRFVNDAGVRGALTFDQREQAEAVGVFLRNEFSPADNVTLIVGLRYDRVELAVRDRFLANADQSGRIEFDELSPTAGVVLELNPNASVYATYATAFETPTFTELAVPARNLDVSLGGFNNVNAQDAESFEVGLRGSFFGQRLYLDIAAFTMEVDDEITSVSNIGNRSFFENADTQRNGVEAYATLELAAGLRLSAAYTYSDFQFDRFDSNIEFDGNSLPGLPDHQLFAELEYQHPSGVYVVADVLHVDELYGNNANSVRSDSYTVANLRAGAALRFGSWQVEPFVGVNNLFSESYMSDVRINGFGGRLFEPEPKRNAYGGISVRFDVR